MDLALLISLIGIAVSCGAYVLARIASQSREFNGCEIAVVVTDVASGTAKAFGMSAATNYTATRYTWIAKLTMDAVSQMLTLVPEADARRLVVDVRSAKFFNVKGFF